jgi:hypothetical protein
LFIPGVASPGGAGYDFFWGNQSRIGWRGGRMHWARILAFVFAGMPIYVGLTAEDRRQNKHVRFAYGMYYQDQGFVPID